MYTRVVCRLSLYEISLKLIVRNDYLFDRQNILSPHNELHNIKDHLYLQFLFILFSFFFFLWMALNGFYQPSVVYEFFSFMVLFMLIMSASKHFKCYRNRNACLFEESSINNSSTCGCYQCIFKWSRKSNILFLKKFQFVTNSIVTTIMQNKNCSNNLYVRICVWNFQQIAL